MAENAVEKRPLVLGHRGASGRLPENTLAAFSMAVDQGADGVELDVVPTKDGKLIVRHENNLSLTTNASAVYPDRVRTKTVEGREERGVFSEDLTLDDVRALRATQRFDFRDHSHDGVHPIPTFSEALAWRRERSAAAGRELLMHVEIKSPAHFLSLGLATEPLILAELGRLDRPDSPIALVSFDHQALANLRGLTAVPLTPILHPREPAPTPQGLAKIATWAGGASFHKSVLAARPELIAQARASGLKVMSWTFRQEARFVEPEFAGDPAREVRRFTQLGVDLLYADWPGEAIAAARSPVPGA